MVELMPDWLTRRAADLPDAPAVICGDTTWSFAELDRQAQTTAERLHALGIGAGDRVAVLLRNGLPFVSIVHALSKLRAILVPLNTRLTAAELAWQLADARARLLIHDAAMAMLAQAATEHTGLCRLSMDQDDVSPALDNLAGAPFETTGQIDLRATHVIMYTSGTTGRPKGVILTYGNHWWNAVGSALNLGHDPADRWLAVLPLFHIGGLAILLRSVIYGIPAIIHPRFDPLAVNAAIERDGATIVSLVATMLERMLDARGDRPYPPTLRAVLLGGGPAPRALLERCARLDVPVIQTYGMTETASQAATLAPADALRKLGSAGRPLLPVELRILREGRPVPPGEIGEIVARGPTVTPGYADRPDATARAIRDGWLHTGDLGFLDAEGYLYIVDRRDDLIISGGENVYPAEVEAVLRAHPAVADAAVVGLSDPHWGQRVAAAVAVRPSQQITAAALIAFCESRLARYKLPREIRFVAEVPRNAGGKLLRHVVRDSWPPES